MYLQLESSWEGIEKESLDPPARLEESLFLKIARKPFRFCLFSFFGVCGEHKGLTVDSSTEKKS